MKQKTSTLLLSMIKEEWRLHTISSKNQSFKMFPLIIFIASLLGSWSIPFFLRIVSIPRLFFYVHLFFLLFGLSIGAFGLFGKEIMNRRFGQISLIAYSSRSLPVSEKAVFFSFFIKDILFYLFLWILPIFIGFLVISPVIGFSITASLFACFTLFLSFLLGLSLVFLLSTIYAHSNKLLILILSGIGAIFIFSNVFSQIQLESLLISYHLFYQKSLLQGIAILLLITISTIISILFVNINYSEKKKHYQNLLLKWSKRLGFSKYSYFIAKDFIDLKRSEGGLGKIIFSFLLPVLFTYVFLNIFVDLIPSIKTIMIFALFLGIVSSTIYNMITEFDSFTTYLFLPVKVSTILQSKIVSYFIINLFSLFILIMAGVTMRQLDFLFPALITFISIMVYTLAVTMYLTGLHPNLLLYDPKNFIAYIGLLAPILFIITLFAIIIPYSMLASILLIPLSYWFFIKSFKKWNQWKPMNI